MKFWKKIQVQRRAQIVELSLVKIAKSIVRKNETTGRERKTEEEKKRHPPCFFQADAVS